MYGEIIAKVIETLSGNGDMECKSQTVDFMFIGNLGDGCW